MSSPEGNEGGAARVSGEKEHQRQRSLAHASKHAGMRVRLGQSERSGSEMKAEPSSGPQQLR